VEDPLFILRFYPNPLRNHDQFFRSFRHAAGVAPVVIPGTSPEMNRIGKAGGLATSSSEALLSIRRACAAGCVRERQR